MQLSDEEGAAALTRTSRRASARPRRRSISRVSAASSTPIGASTRQARAGLVAFLEEVTPAAEALGAQLTLHPDDPPRAPLRPAAHRLDGGGLRAVFHRPSPANGMCFCTGSLGVRPDNDLPAIARRFADRIHFVHLRATKRDADGLSFRKRTISTATSARSR